MNCFRKLDVILHYESGQEGKVSAVNEYSEKLYVSQQYLSITKTLWITEKIMGNMGRRGKGTN
jgi:hypothetical protein